PDTADTSASSPTKLSNAASPPVRADAIEAASADAPAQATTTAQVQTPPSAPIPPIAYPSSLEVQLATAQEPQLVPTILEQLTETLRAANAPPADDSSTDSVNLEQGTDDAEALDEGTTSADWADGDDPTALAQDDASDVTDATDPADLAETPDPIDLSTVQGPLTNDQWMVELAGGAGRPTWHFAGPALIKNNQNMNL